MELTPSARYPALQYLDDVDQGGVADLAGLRKGDFLIQVSRTDPVPQLAPRNTRDISHNLHTTRLYLLRGYWSRRDTRNKKDTR